ncbi:hypothetical protein [Actinoplanes sp. NPDC049802]|uniref:hypothetical protein n=1 Tax=Actinoplanes sp. NPDC049802 TaxID=3154742 RepID=UPI0034041770
MIEDSGAEAVRRLAARGVHIEPGLTGAEFDRIERTFGFAFADDHRAFLAAGLPLDGPRWPDWRDGGPEELRERLGRPVEGVLFDVEHNGFWHREWGERPDGTAAALGAARRHLARVPTLVPVFGHRYLPSGRGSSGHPVLSVYQTDIIYYGVDLLDYLHREFGTAPGRNGTDDPEATVPFWRDFV